MREPTNPQTERRALALIERLSEHPGDDGFRRRILKGESPTVLARVERLERMRDALSVMPTAFPGEVTAAPRAAPERFGPFRLVEMVGAGGMGDVWRGERDDGLYDQTVAIKLIQSHLQTRAGEAFEAERRILARLEHPNIARLIDGGAASDGRPCLVMEFVDGKPIDEACAELPLARRISLFTEAARAVAYAHGRLVAHGDLKPSNILADAAGRVRLLDFGIARLMTDEAQAIQLSGAVTASYASPQRLAGDPPSIPDDVFALGRLLSRLAGNAPDADLEAIIAKATADREADRYASVADLTADLERRGQGRPVSAVPATFGYTAGKYLKRNWRGVAAASLLGLTITSGGLFYLNGRREHAEAGARFDDARGASRYLLFTLYDQLADRPASLALRREVAGVAQHYLNRLAQSRSTVPEVRLEAARGLLRLARVQGGPGFANLGRPELERASLDAALKQIATATSAEALRIRAQVLLESSDVAEFVEEDEARARRDIAAAKSLMDRDPSTPADMREGYFNLLSIIERWSDHWPQAKSAAEQALALIPNDEALPSLLARSEALQLLGDALAGEKDQAGAIAAYHQSAAVAERTVALFPGNHVGLRHQGTAHYNLGKALIDGPGQSAQGLAMLERSAQEKRAEVAFDPDDDNAKRSLRIVLSGLETALEQNGRVDEGLALMRNDLAELKSLWLSHPAEARRLRDYAEETAMLANAQVKYGRIPPACENYARSRALFETMAHQGHLSAEDRDHQLGEIVKSQDAHCR